MTFRDGQAKGSPNHAMPPAAALLSAHFLGCARLVVDGLFRPGVTGTAGASGHRLDGGRSRSARRRRFAGAPLRQLPRRAGPGPATGRALCTGLLHLEPVGAPAHAHRESRIPGSGRGAGQIAGRNGRARRRDRPGGAYQPTCTTSIWSWCARAASGRSATRTGARIDAGVDLCNMRSILRVVFNRPPAKRSLQRASAVRSRAAESC